jgi:hypothetical protein
VIEVTLPSGTILEISEAPFEDCLALHDVVLEELRVMKFSFNAETGSMLAEALMILAPSKKVRAAIEKCMARSLCAGVQMKAGFWKGEHVKREDYLPAMRAVAEENIRPFMQSLVAEYISIGSKITGFQASRLKTEPLPNS